MVYFLFHYLSKYEYVSQLNIKIWTTERILLLVNRKTQSRKLLTDKFLLSLKVKQAYVETWEALYAVFISLEYINKV